jgi:hypothetical protein
MSDKEIQRAIDDELRATQEKQKKAEQDDKEKEGGDEGDEKKVKKVDENYAKDFQVYPSVNPPPPESIPKFIILFVYCFRLYITTNIQKSKVPVWIVQYGLVLKRKF